MWKFVSCGNSNGKPLLDTVNDHIGRQYWEFDATVGTPEERAEVERLRTAFTANRHKKRDSDDALIRLQAKQRIVEANIRVPSLPIDKTAPLDEDRINQHLTAAIKFYECLQAEDGHWPGDYAGPMFLLPGLVIAAYVTKSLDVAFPEEHRKEVLRYLKNHQNLDGGFGLHIEGQSCMFGTSLNYTVMRIMGMEAEEEEAVLARSWIQKHEGVVTSTSWGKFWLAVLGVYKWEGLNPLTPEMWLLPYSKLSLIGILHPGRFWCHCRMVYLPMSYVYGARHKLEDKVNATQLVKDLRHELYVEDYENVDWNACRNKVAPEDAYFPHPMIQDLLWWGLYKIEPFLKGSSLREKALNEVMKLVHYEDVNTRYIDIGPVNKAVNMLACWLEDPNSEAFQKHLLRVPDYLWIAEDGMKMQGYNGSQLWDTSFSLQAIIECGLETSFKDCLRKGHQFLHRTQVRKEAAAPLSEFYRHISLGAWPFSTQDHGWPISDCTSEALKAALLLRQLPIEDVGPPIEPSWFFQAVNVILSYQNSDGGMATYENSRSYAFLELLNPSETFGDIIIDYSCVECTSACIQSLSAFALQFPEHRTNEIRTAIEKAIGFVKNVQREDGSWYGSWGVCFTYGAMFGLSALAAFDEFYNNSEPSRKACDFILSKQREDGGWGESYLSCQEKVYSQLDGDSHVVNTAWAMIALMKAKYHTIRTQPLDAGARFLLQMQTSEGDWPQQHISGVFNRNCMITYTNYRYLFPIWALGMYKQCVLKQHQ